MAKVPALVSSVLWNVCSLPKGRSPRCGLVEPAHTELAEFAPSVLPAKCQWWNTVTLDTSFFFGAKEFFGGSQSCTNFEWIHAGAPLHVECVIAVPEEPIFHRSSSCGRSQVTCGHFGHFLWLCRLRAACCALSAAILGRKQFVCCAIVCEHFQCDRGV